MQVWRERLSATAGQGLYRIVLLGMALFMLVALAPANSPSGLVDTDSYVHLVRAEELARGLDWFSSAFPRANAPFGDTLHWTRPFDLLLIALASPLVPWEGWTEALRHAGIAVGPLSFMGTLLALFWAGRRALSARGVLLAGLLFLGQAGALMICQAGRADHHGLLLLIFALLLGHALRAAEDFAPKGRGHSSVTPNAGLWAGILSGLALWISTESCVMVGLGAGVELVGWAIHGQSDRLRRYGLSLALTTWAAIAIERGSGLLVVEHDRISVVHGVAALLVLALACLLPLVPVRRYLSLIEGSGLCLGAMSLLFPGYHEGPLADVPSAMRTDFLATVKEMRPLLDMAHPEPSLAIVLGGSAVIALLLHRVFIRKGRWPLVLSLVAYLLLSLVHRRWAPYLGVPAVLILAGFVDRAIRRMEPGQGAFKAGCAGAIITLTLLFAPYAAAVLALRWDAPAAEAGCRLEEIVPTLLAEAETRGLEDPIVMAGVNQGPELLYLTPFRVVGSPYHRNVDGVADTLAFYRSTEEAEARAILEKRGVTWILVCPSTFAAPAWLNAESPPTWLERIPCPSGPSSLQIYRTPF